MGKDPTSSLPVTGVILAGGLARRMGGADKGLVKLGDVTMIEHVIDALRPQVATILINANRNKGKYATRGYPVIADLIDGYCGPLAGMASAMQSSGNDYIVTVPCDSPFIPEDLVERLYSRINKESADICVAHDGQRMQPVFALMKCSLHASLLSYLQGGNRKIDHWYAAENTVVEDFSDQPDTFLNINTPEDIQTAMQKIKESSR